MNIRIIKKEKEIVHCKARTIENITNSLIDSLPWEKDTNRILFEFDEIISNEHKILKENISNKYSVRLIYYVNVDDLIVPSVANKATNIVVKKADLSEIQSLYLTTVSKLNGELPYKIAQAKLRFSKMVAEKYLSVDRSLYLTYDTKPIGLLTTVKIKDPLLNCFVDCINWVWIDKDLPFSEKMNIYKFIIQWLKENSEKLISCYIDLFNWRSQRISKRVGFKPKCLIIEKSQ